MLINAVTFTFPSERADEAEAMLRQLRAASLEEPGCFGYEVCRGNDERATFVLYEKWRDQAALDEHYAAEHFVRLATNGFRTFMLNRTAIKGTPVE